MPKSRWFWPILGTLILADCSTKELVETTLAGNPGPHPLMGEWLRVTLAYNPGAAMNLSFGDASRAVFGGFAVAAILAILVLYRRTAPEARLRAAALALVAGGAMGNLLDRLRSPLGVVDFIDVGIGDARFWTFNLADVGVAVGAMLLAMVLWRDERPRAEAA
ncbi:MAG TPA: signal peptidase II [Gemmatimonadales bacterium]|jgi:signal peptidase II